MIPKKEWEMFVALSHVKVKQIQPVNQNQSSGPDKGHLFRVKRVLVWTRTGAAALVVLH